MKRIICPLFFGVKTSIYTCMDFVFIEHFWDVGETVIT